MNVLYVLSPSDRMNYGDLLFSHIIKHYFENHFQKIIFCSTKGADLSRYGAIRTHGYETLFNAPKEHNNYLIVAGGDCLFINWPMIISFIDKTSNFIECISNKLNIDLYDKYIGARYNIKTKFPFTIGKNELSNFKCILYNSLGGSFIEGHPNIINEPYNKKILDSVDYLSTRDFKAHQILNANGFNSFCFPDSAILVSDIFKDEFIKENVSKQNKHLIEKYIFFQISIRHLEGNAKFYASILDLISTKFGVNVLLCPIGTAPGHSDDTSLKLIFKASMSGNLHLINQPSIWDILFLIKNATLYIGTSLHGAITALSYNRPIVGFGAKKLIGYIKYWHPESVVCCNKNELFLFIEQQLKRPVISNVDRAKDMVLKSFENMYKFIS